MTKSSELLQQWLEDTEARDRLISLVSEKVKTLPAEQADKAVSILVESDVKVLRWFVAKLLLQNAYMEEVLEDQKYLMRKLIKLHEDENAELPSEQTGSLGKN